MASKLTARKVETAKPGKYSDGGNLYLVVSDTGVRKWVLRFTWRGRVKEMGLGSATSVPLADAREKTFATNAAPSSTLLCSWRLKRYGGRMFASRGLLRHRSCGWMRVIPLGQLLNGHSRGLTSLGPSVCVLARQIGPSPRTVSLLV